MEGICCFFKAICRDHRRQQVNELQSGTRYAALPLRLFPRYYHPLIAESLYGALPHVIISSHLTFSLDSFSVIIVGLLVITLGLSDCRCLFLPGTFYLFIYSYSCSVDAASFQNKFLRISGPQERQVSLSQRWPAFRPWAPVNPAGFSKAKQPPEPLEVS